jgi:hypothetical protein
MRIPAEGVEPPVTPQSSGWTYLPPRFQSLAKCDEILAAREPSLSLRIIAHQNWLRFYLNAARDYRTRHRQMEALLNVAGPSIRAAVQRMTSDPDEINEWKQRFDKKLLSSQVGLRARLIWLARLNDHLLQSQDISLDGISGALIQIAKNLDIFDPQIVPERAVDAQAFNILIGAVRDLRSMPLALKEIERAIGFPYHDSAVAAESAIRRLSLITATIPSRIAVLILRLDGLYLESGSMSHDIETTRTQGAMEDHLLTPREPAGSLELAHREIYNEMIIYLHEIQNYTQLARMKPGILK